ncbi:peptidylprolyl isomerase [Variovorax dokdonensis]|uniref:Chaperone SurA n=1 Tax=Variovorax dokdonensis TaxID=344883 RepID=A0ABT7N9G5_9BURK|nr:peptidylprolyl isomerase [Variovorax dokdonensis]MDM0044571.1 peptidylprolyl isomerase [Variovorax dokdonensis]
MSHLRTSPSPLRITALAALAILAGSANAQGITDFMRARPPQLRAPSPTPAPTAVAPGTQRVAQYIVALVNSEPITNSEVQNRIERVVRQGGAEVQRIPAAELNRLALERIITEKAQLQTAREAGIKIDDLAVDQAVENVARQNQISVAEMRRQLEASGDSMEAFRQDVRSQLLLLRLREREVEPKVRVTDLEVDQYLQEQRDKAGGAAAPEEINLAQVLVALPENASADRVAKAEQKAQDIARRARAGEDFGALAREFSDSPDKANGGAMGLRAADRYPALFTNAVAATQVGGVAGPVRSSAGFHVLKVVSKAKLGDGATITQTKVRHILLRVDDKRSTAQAVATLGDFKRRIEAGTATFEGLARDNSQDGSARDGGELGWSRPGLFVPEFEDAMNRLAKGQVSDPVVSRFGVHLIQVEDRREAKLSQAEQRDAARAALREKRLEEAYETWSQEVRARAYVEYRQPPQS